MSDRNSASSSVVFLTEEQLLKMLSENCSASIDNNYQIENDDGLVLSMKEYKAFQAEKFIKENAIPFPDKEPLPPLILNKVSFCAKVLHFFIRTILEEPKTYRFILAEI